MLHQPCRAPGLRPLSALVLTTAMVTVLAPVRQAHAQGRLIHQDDLPLRITESGVWTVAEDLLTEGEQLTVAAPDVTLELAGYTIDGGIWVESGDGLTVRNGTIIGNYPYYLITGNPPGCATVENLMLFGDARGTGIQLGDGAVARSLSVVDGRFDNVLVVGHDSRLTDITATETVELQGDCGILAGDRCEVRNYTTVYTEGIRVGSHSWIEDCDIRPAFTTPLEAGAFARVVRSRFVTDPGSAPDLHHRGTVLGDGSVISDCHVVGPYAVIGGENVRVLDCEVWCYETAITVESGSLVQGCRIQDGYKGAGIDIRSDTRVIDNQFATFLYPKYGILVEGDRNHIEGNSLTSYWHGINLHGSQNVLVDNHIWGHPEITIYIDGQANRVEGNLIDGVLPIGIRATPGNVIVGNTLRNNMGQAFDVAPGNVLGEVIDLSNGGVLPPNNCWANVIE